MSLDILVRYIFPRYTDVHHGDNITLLVTVVHKGCRSTYCSSWGLLNKPSRWEDLCVLNYIFFWCSRLEKH